MAANHHFSAPVELHEDEEFGQTRLFTQDRRYAALDVNTGRISGSRVVTVSDDIQWDQALESAGAQVLSQIPGVATQARAAYIRSALRPASRGDGRDRWR